MNLKFIKPSTLDKNLKATAHKSGKLGFTIEAAKKLKLAETKSANIAINTDDFTDTNLYITINEAVESDSYKINKAGAYFYINTKALFDDMKIDYVNDSIVYDISLETIDGQSFFKFRRRPNKKVPEISRDKIS